MEKWEVGTLRDTQVELFELDIKAMFPSLPIDGVWDALWILHDLRQWGRGQGHELRFAINRLVRKLDRLGLGVSACYTNIKWSEVQQFLLFDIYRNDYFVVANADCALCPYAICAVGQQPPESFWSTCNNRKRDCGGILRIPKQGGQGLRPKNVLRGTWGFNGPIWAFVAILWPPHNPPFMPHPPLVLAPRCQISHQFGGRAVHVHIS